MRKSTLGLFYTLFFLACQNPGATDTTMTEVGETTLTADDGGSATSDEDDSTTVSITEIQSGSSTATNPLEGYSQSEFSKYVYIANSGKKFLIDFNFFPEGTDFDSQEKTVTIPCEYTEMPEEVDVNVSVDVEESDCESEIVIDLSGASFSFVGLEFAYEESLDVFDDNFEFKISTDGFVDSLDGEKIDVAAEDANLENIYNAVIDKRI